MVNGRFYDLIDYDVERKERIYTECIPFKKVYEEQPEKFRYAIARPLSVRVTLGYTPRTYTYETSCVSFYICIYIVLCIVYIYVCSRSIVT